MWPLQAGAGRGSACAPHGCSHLALALSPPHTGNLSVVWCHWTEPVGLSPGRDPGSCGGVACGVDSALGPSVPSGHCQSGDMDASGELPKPKGLQIQRVPGLAALAAIKHDKSEKQGREGWTRPRLCPGLTGHSWSSRRRAVTQGRGSFYGQTSGV